MRRISKFVLFVALIIIMAGNTLAQNPNNALLYSSQATLFGDQGPASDPVSVIMPGTAFKSGFGAFIDNPASMALHRKSFGELGFSYRTVEEDAIYLGQQRLLDDSQRGISNFGFLYSLPTLQGSFVFGAGYTQHSIYNRAFGFRARNENSTITDKFKFSGSPYQDIAFNTFATDFGDEFEDWDESIFRIGFDRYGDFLGLRQQGEIIQRGYSGEYSMFFATEFQENLMIGGSIGLLSGRFRYNRVFQEVDEFNDYNSTIIDSNDDGFGDTDVDNILLDDRLRSSFAGFRARVGILYKLSDNFQVGASYTFPTTIEVDEIFDANLRTTFNNGVEFSDFTDSEFSYKVKYPSRTSLGLGIVNLSGLSVSLSAEYVDYSKTRVDYGSSEFFEDELAENDFIESEFRSVWSLRGGASYDLSPEFTLRAGYSYLPGRFLNGDDDRSVYMIGAGFSLTRNIRLELAAQYTEWDEQSAVYEYAQYNYSPLPDNIPSINFRSEDAARSVERWQVLGTLRVNF
ncbi:MAG: hypothetical protein EA359_03005 [Balneolaceae bacterium]|nr:MAG: hypothetical protein EA359_03005 [Balneolaceae bacterium]